jgi:hypothetical protein
VIGQGAFWKISEFGNWLRTYLELLDYHGRSRTRRRFLAEGNEGLDIFHIVIISSALVGKKPRTC